MSHHTHMPEHLNLAERLNKAPIGAPPSKTLYEILKLLFTRKEAELVATLPIKPFTVNDARKYWDVDISQAQTYLDQLCNKALLLDMEQQGEQHYLLPPPMAGFFEFSLMRLGTGAEAANQKVLAELYYQYMNVEEPFITELFNTYETPLVRTFVHEPVVKQHDTLIFDYERATHVIEDANTRAVGTCYCRHKMHHLGKACDAPLEDICMTFGSAAKTLIRSGRARPIDKVEGLDILQKAYDHDLVQCGSNEQQKVSFMCNCCGCCCEALLALKTGNGFMSNTFSTNFEPQIDTEQCNGCNLCVIKCPVEAMLGVSKNDPKKPKATIVKVDKKMCIGCGICAKVCHKRKAIRMIPKEQRVITPVSTAHRMVVSAIERGKLQHLIFDKQAFWYHRIMASILGVILKLPPIKQLLANEQVKSTYLAKLFSHC